MEEKRRRKRPAWCKRARIAMIEQDLGLDDLIKKTGMTKSWLCAVINGRAYSQASVKLISDALNIDDTYDSP